MVDESKWQYKEKENYILNVEGSRRTVELLWVAVILDLEEKTIEA